MDVFDSSKDFQFTGSMGSLSTDTVFWVGAANTLSSCASVRYYKLHRVELLVPFKYSSSLEGRRSVGLEYCSISSAAGPGERLDDWELQLVVSVQKSFGSPDLALLS